MAIKIKNEKELDQLLDDQIKVPVYWQYRDVSQTNIIIDEESIKEEFESKLKEIVEAVDNY